MYFILNVFFQSSFFGLNTGPQYILSVLQNKVHVEVKALSHLQTFFMNCILELEN